MIMIDRKFNKQFRFANLMKTVLLEKLVISLLNFRSSRKHFDDITSTSSLIQTDMLRFTETQLLPSQGGFDLPAKMRGFYVTYDACDDRFCILALCYRDNLHLLNHVKMNAFSILTFRNPSFSDEKILLYKKTSVLRGLFLSQLQDLLCNEQIQIILGDFDTDAFNSNNNASLSKSLERYFMVVRDPTHLSGSLIDHVYLSNATLDKLHVTAKIKNIYFSDHDTVNLELR